MTALSDALTAAQRSALAALEKAYVADKIDKVELSIRISMIGLTDTERIPERIMRRGGVGPEQPEWDDVETYSAEWYRRFRDWHRAEFPDADATTLDNLDMLVRLAERTSDVITD